MNFAALYRLSFYAMLVASTLVLSIDAVDNKIAMAYPVAVAVAAGAAFLTVDRDPERGLSPLLLNLGALGSVGLAVIEYLVDPALLLLALGHWLVYLQLVLMFRPKSVSEEWELFLLGLVQVLVGAVISQSDRVGAALFAWAVLALWVLGLFSLRREARRARGGDYATVTPGAREGETYPGLLNVPFLFSALRVVATTMALGGIIFLAMPRRPGMARTRGGENPGQHLTGFDDEVQLGQLGEILENDTIVMSVETADGEGRPYVPDGEPLWRGVTMTVYENGRWHRQRPLAGSFPIALPSMWLTPQPGRHRGVVRQRIKLEPNDSSVLFGLRPMFDASARRYAPELNSVDGTIWRTDARGGAYDYEVRSSRDLELPQPGELVPGEHRLHEALLNVPEEIRPRLREIAEREIARRVPPDRRDDPRSKARALESYLRDSGEFGYTLKLDQIDRDLDPVLDFLINRKEGHCEYFGSALALLLRAVDVPARMINGFKGGDLNELTGVMSVRQKHAHSWVEAYLGVTPPPDHSPLWLTLDGTPGTERDRSVAQVGGFRANFYQITDAVRYVWVFYIVGYDAERQNRLIYGPIRALIREARRGFTMMAHEAFRARTWLRHALHFPDARSLISVRGFVVSFVALLLLVGLARGGSWAVHRVLRRLRGADGDGDGVSAGAAHYRRLAQLLAEFDLERPPAETHEEFARRAAVYLSARGSEAAAVADVPRAVVEAFYRVRFGHRDLGAAAHTLLERRLDALEATLRAEPG